MTTVPEMHSANLRVRYTGNMSHKLYRRDFLKLLFLSGTMVGCRSLIAGQATPTSPSPPTLDVPPTVILDLRYVLENQAVDYGKHPEGCDRTTIKGRIRDEQGNGVPDIVLRIWSEDGSWSQVVISDANGSYAVDVASGTSELTYLVQLYDIHGTTILSDAVVIQAIPDCGLNLMTVNFVPGS
jgi:hypothetical protein